MPHPPRRVFRRPFCHVWRAWAVLLFGAMFFAVACSDAPPTLTPLGTNATILAFGDSLSAGVGAGGFGSLDREKSYPARLAARIPQRVEVAAVPGEVTARGLARLPQALQRFSPDLVLLCHGGNDLIRRFPMEQTAANLRAMVTLCRDAGAQVVLIAVPRPGILLSPPSFYEDIAREYGLPLEEKTLSTILSDADLKSDPFHPNAKGYALLATRVEALLREAGALPPQQKQEE